MRSIRSFIVKSSTKHSSVGPYITINDEFVGEISLGILVSMENRNRPSHVRITFISYHTKTAYIKMHFYENEVYNIQILYRGPMNFTCAIRRPYLPTNNTEWKVDQSATWRSHAITSLYLQSLNFE